MLVQLFQAEVLGVLNETGTELGFFLGLWVLVMGSGPCSGGEFSLVKEAPMYSLV